MAKKKIEPDFYAPGFEKWKSVLIYGAPRTGKTVCASTAPRPLFLDCEGGLLSLRDVGRDVKAVRIRSVQELSDMVEWLEQNADPEKREFDTVVIDSVTEVQVILVEHLVSKSGSDTPDIRTWGLVFNKMRSITKIFRDLPYHIVFTALERLMKDEESGRMYFGPDLLGQSADKIPAYFDFILRAQVVEERGKDGLRTGNAEYKLITRGGNNFFAGARTTRLEAQEDPDLTAIFAKASGEKEEVKSE